jgi:rhodanese-related sulfurtransferase
MHQTVHDLINAVKDRIREVSPAELLELQRAGSPVIDVREPDEFAEDHIPGAVNIPRGLLEFEVDGHPAVNYQTAAELSHRERPVVLYCLSGGRSLLAADALQRLGFRSPVSLGGGILGWADDGQPVATPAALDPVLAQCVSPLAGCQA